MQQQETLPAPKVSIVVPVYNAERFLEQTLQSVIQQDFTDWELLLINDCSTDNSVKIIQTHNDDKRIRLVNLEKNSGAAVARNRGIALSRGKYIAFLDSDDIWMTDKLSKQVSFMEKDKHAFSFTEIRMTDEDGTPVSKVRSIPKKVDYRYLLHKTVIATSSVMLDKAYFGDFSMPLRRSGQDYATWLMLLRKAPYAYCLQEPLVNYRVVKNLCHQTNLQVLNRYTTYKHQTNIFPDGVQPTTPAVLHSMHSKSIFSDKILPH